MSSGEDVRPVRLFDFPFSGNGYKVRLALAQLGLTVEHVVADFLRGETRRPEFLKMNPMGQIPVLELSNGVFLRESNAILVWLCEGTHLWPDTRLGRARMVQWMTFEQNHIDKVIGRARFFMAYPAVMPDFVRDFAAWREQGHWALGLMETELERNDWFAGDSYTAADISLYAYTHVAAEGGFSHEPFPRLRAWMDRVRRQPRYIPL